MPKAFNREQRRAIKNTPFSMSEIQRALDCLKNSVVPGVDGLLAEAYQRLTLPSKCRLAARIWDIVMVTTPIPPEWANRVHPLYKKGDWAQPRNWRPIVCATTEVKLVCKLILGRIAPAAFPHVPASIWGAMVGRSPHEAIFLKDTALDMNPYEMIVASLDVQGAFRHAPHRLLTEVWDAMGLPFLPFMARYIKTWLDAVTTAAGPDLWTGTDSGVPQDGAEGPFLYTLITLPLAFELAREYPGYAAYPLRSPLINLADDNLLITANRHRDPANAGLPTTTDLASAILQLTTTYLDAQHILVHPSKSVGLADVGTPAPPIQKDEPRTWRTPQSTRGSHKPPGFTTSHSQTSWKDASPNYLSLPWGTSGLRRAWHTSWRRCSTQLLDNRPYHPPPDPQGALHHARQQVTKTWPEHGGWLTSFPEEAIVADRRYYGDNTGALVNTAYAKHAVHLLHRMTHKDDPEICEAAAIRINEAQTACNACPRWILAQHGVPTSMDTGIWAQLQLLVPHHTHAILTNHHCDQQGPLVDTYTDIRQHPAGKAENPTPRGSQLHHAVHHPHADESHGPMRSPPGSIPL